jgi:hypothetical protein
MEASGSKITIIIIFFILIVSFIVLNPIPNSRIKDRVKIEGKVVKLYGGGIKDLVIAIENDDSFYYINRGLENGFSIEKLEKLILNKNVSLHYIKHWSVLNYKGKSRHIYKLSYLDTIIYNEL